MSSKLTYHYLAIGRLGRGEVVRLFLQDAGIDFDEKRYPYDDTWPAASAKLKQEGITATGKLPAIEYKGKVLIQHIPILRYLARDLGKYDGETTDEKYLVDVVTDAYIDWRSAWVDALVKGASEDYKTKTTVEYYKLVAEYYSKNKGPYLLGDKITYADFAVYQSWDNDKRIGTLPSSIPAEITKLVEAFGQRPNIAAYIKENEHKD
ncbi:glutathione transferase-like protein [Microdochium nivale]|nr:glutathione transferase-like protein [Microdochium nivale]